MYTVEILGWKEAIDSLQRAIEIALYLVEKGVVVTLAGGPDAR